MTKITETEFKLAFDKTIAFLTKESDTMCQVAALEMMGKSEDEIRIIWNRIVTDFWNMGVKYFIREIRKNRQKTQAV